MFSASRRTDPEVEAEPVTAASIAARVRVPGSLALARRNWRQLQTEHGQLQLELRQQVVALAAANAQHERQVIERQIAEIDGKINALASKVRTALTAITAAAPSFAEAVETALTPMRTEAAAEAIGAIDRLAGALARLGEIDAELRPLGGQTWELRRMQPNLGTLRRRIVGLVG